MSFDSRYRAVTHLALFVITILLPWTGSVAVAQESTTEDTPKRDVIRCDAKILDQMGSNKSGYQANLWTTHVIPYDYSEDYSTPVNVYTGTSVEFVNSSPPVIRYSGGDFSPKRFQAGDEILVSGSNSNDVSGPNSYLVTDVSSIELELRPEDVLVNEAPGAAVTIYSTRKVSDPQQALFEAVLAEWEAVADVRFVRRTSEPDYILLTNSNYNRTGVGRVGIGGQWLELRDWSHQPTVLHELGHSLGLIHEQSRTDRDYYVIIHDENIEAGAGGNFQIFWDSDAYPVGEHAIYDFGSLMHYDDSAFSANGSVTIEVREPWAAQWQDLIGTASEPSRFDRLTVSFLYPPADWKFLYASAPSTTGVGTFHNPYQGFAYAESRVPAGGRLVILYPDVYDAVGVYSEAKLIQAPIGGVVLH